MLEGVHIGPGAIGHSSQQHVFRVVYPQSASELHRHITSSAGGRQRKSKEYGINNPQQYPSPQSATSLHSPSGGMVVVVVGVYTHHNFRSQIGQGLLYVFLPVSSRNMVTSFDVYTTITVQSHHYRDFHWCRDYCMCFCRYRLRRRLHHQRPNSHHN